MNLPLFSEEDFQPETLFRNPDIYPLQFEGPNTIFVRMTEATFKQSIFTDFQRIVSTSNQALRVPTIELLGQYESLQAEQPQLGYIFHVAHCGSTLLARALDEVSQLLVYREPSTLRQLAAEFSTTNTDPPGKAMWPQRLRLTTGMLGRSYSNSQTVLVKANVPVNFILPQLLALSAKTSAILLYAPLRGYLLSVLKSPQHQQWVDHVIRELAGAIKRIPLLANIEPDSLSPAQAAGCLWLAQTMNFRQLVAGNDRVRTLDCEILFERPADTLTAAFSLFGIDVAAEKIGQIVSGDLFSHHSKSPGVSYDNAARKAELEQLAQSLGNQIDEGIAWVSDIVPSEELLDPLPKPLL